MLQPGAALVVLRAGGRKLPKLEVPLVEHSVEVYRNLVAGTGA